MDEATQNRDAKKIIRTIERNKRVFNQTYVEMPTFDGTLETLITDKNSRFAQVMASDEFDINIVNPVPIQIPSPLMKWPKVYVNDKDPIIMAYTLQAECNESPLIVYNACHTNRGGGSKEGSTSIEAEICRRSNYWKALKRASAHYPLKRGMAIHSSDVEVFKNSKYKLLNKSFKVDLLSVVMPQKPSKIVIGDQDYYENRGDRELVIRILKSIFNFGHNILIFCNFGLDQPVDEFLNLLNREIGIAPINKIYFTLPNGGTVGLNETEQRTNYIKFCQQLDNRSKPVSERADCEEPPRLEIIMPHQEKRKKMLRTVVRDKKDEEPDPDDNSDDCKSIAQLDSSDDDF